MKDNITDATQLLGFWDELQDPKFDQAGEQLWLDQVELEETRQVIRERLGSLAADRASSTDEELDNEQLKDIDFLRAFLAPPQATHPTEAKRSAKERNKPSRSGGWTDQYERILYHLGKSPHIEIDVADRAIFIKNKSVYDFGDSPHVSGTMLGVGRVLEHFSTVEVETRIDVSELATLLGLSDIMKPHEIRNIPSIISSALGARMGYNRYEGNNYLVKKAPFTAAITNSEEDKSFLLELCKAQLADTTAKSTKANGVDLVAPQSNREIEEDLTQVLISGKVPTLHNQREAILLMGIMVDDVMVELLIERHGAKFVQDVKAEVSESAEIQLGYHAYTAARRARQIRSGDLGTHHGSGARFVTGKEEASIIHPESDNRI